MTAIARREDGGDLAIADGQVATLTRPARFGTVTLGGWCVLDLNGMATCQRIIWSRHDVPSIVVHSDHYLEIGGGTAEQHRQIEAWWKHRAEVMRARRNQHERPLIVLDLSVG